DTGAAGCDSTDAPASQGLGVNGLASTPYNLAVGGTQFNDSQGTYWAATNSATDFSSALGYIPEWAWNESCVNGSCIAAGGGGRSAIYPKPDWQNAPGVPGDGARDLPDVSFNASEGIPYLTCAGMNCQPGQYTTAAGTSASTQAFASALALLVQETGEWQGLIAPELYRFAASQPAGACNAATGSNPNCIFNDVTTGSNAVPCTGGSPNCANGDTAQGDGSPAYPGGVGYDLATGLGSVNIANLINAWPTSAPAASQTTLSVSPGAITHGQSVTCQVSVSSGGSTPVGTVAVEDGAGPGALVLGTAQVQAGTATLNLGDLPGGADTLIAQFSGTSAFAPSTSAAVSVQVAPEPSATALHVRQQDIRGNGTTVTSTYYGSYMALDAAVTGASGVGTRSGTVSFLADGEPVSGSPVLLNGGSSAGIQLPLLSVGAHQFGATFSGDPSLGRSAALDVALSVQAAPTNTTAKITEFTLPNGSEQALIQVGVDSTQIEMPDSVMAGTVTVTGPGGAVLGTHPSGSQFLGPFFNDKINGGASFTVPVPAGPPMQVTAHFSGDPNFQDSDSAPALLDSGGFLLSAQQAKLAEATGGAATFQVTASLTSPLLNPLVNLACDIGDTPCALSTPSVTLTPSSPTATFDVTVSVGSAAQFPPIPAGPPKPWLGWAGLAILTAAAARSRRRLGHWACAGTLLLATACGGSPVKKTQTRANPP